MDTKTVSTTAEKPRIAWCFLVLHAKTGYEIHILYKNGRNTLQLFKYNRFKKRMLFGLVVKAELVREQNGKEEEPGDYYKITNEYSDELLFGVSLLNPTLLGDNSFSKKMVEMRYEEGVGDKAIASFISRLAFCQNFSQHDSNSFSPLGRSLLAIGEDPDGEFETFRNVAIEHSSLVTAAREDAVEGIAELTKRKKKSDSKGTKRLTRQERIEKFFRKELKDPEGVEREFITNIKGRADIHLDQLDVCRRVMLPIESEKVKVLAQEMFENLDPSALTLTAVPVENCDNFDAINLEANPYEIVHGRHRLLALKLLKSEGKLKELVMMSEETVTCYILGVTSLSGINFASVRGQKVQAKMVVSPSHHDMVNIIHGMVESFQDPLHVIKVVTRYFNTLKLSDAEKTALKSICKWPLDILKVLVKIISKYEKYQTADCDLAMMKKSNAKLQKGEKLLIPMSVFKKLVKLPVEYLRDNSESILSGALSVKLLVSEFNMKEQTKKKEAMIEKAAGHQSIEKLRVEFPRKFSKEVLDRLPAKSINSNTAIESYTKSILKNDPVSTELEVLDLEQDIQEVKKFIRQSKRPAVRQALDMLIAELKNNMTKYKKSEEEPYKFTDESVQEKSSSPVDKIATDSDDDNAGGSDEDDDASESEEYPDSDPDMINNSKKTDLSRSHLASVDQFDGSSDHPTPRKFCKTSISGHAMNPDRRKKSCSVSRSILTLLNIPANQALAAPVVMTLPEHSRMIKMDEINIELFETIKRKTKLSGDFESSIKSVDYVPANKRVKLGEDVEGLKTNMVIKLGRNISECKLFKLGQRVQATRAGFTEVDIEESFLEKLEDGREAKRIAVSERQMEVLELVDDDPEMLTNRYSAAYVEAFGDQILKYPCATHYHPACLQMEGRNIIEEGSLKCIQCQLARNMCFLCRQFAAIEVKFEYMPTLPLTPGSGIVSKVVMSECDKGYNDECLASNPLWPQARITSALCCADRTSHTGASEEDDDASVRDHYMICDSGMYLTGASIDQLDGNSEPQLAITSASEEVLPCIKINSPSSPSLR